MNRIYIYGASAGGFMTMRTLVAFPNFFAAAVPICPGINPLNIADAEILTLTHLPMWLINAENDTTTPPYRTTDRIHNLLSHSIYTLYPNVVVEGMEFNGHWNWIYVARNMPRHIAGESSWDLTEGETIWAWTARQTLEEEPEPVVYTVTATGGTVVGGAIHEVGSDVTINATIPANHRFVRWENVGTTSIITNANRNNQSITFTMPASHVTVRAVFVRRTAPNPRTIVRRPELIRNNSVALHRGPGPAYHLNRRLSRGQVITVLNDSRSGWSFVQVGNGSVRGWVRNRDITATTTLGTVRVNNVRLRARANGGSTLTRLSRNANITILATNANRSWTQIRVGRRTGWVRTSQIRTITPTSRTRRQIQLLQGPGSSFSRISNSRVNQNARVRVLGRQGNWSRVRIGNRTGWVRTNQLR
jgi:uncharacterized protein YgiM (DUF1202 family)